MSSTVYSEVLKTLREYWNQAENPDMKDFASDVNEALITFQGDKLDKSK